MILTFSAFKRRDSVLVGPLGEKFLHNTMIQAHRQIQEDLRVCSKNHKQFYH
jgi:hypothetical protein